ncbi:ParB/RepB/Spo0J family partition protein [Yersinia enterocolitica]|uniref:ParB/RepB/Spo0J family partition protein n=1 Tax=Yersinia enterocolitica TaxID=630 RepID=UPI001C8D3FE1|nr:chromosome partitioning protein ParB [Yersinia enterocolitica]MBX9476799.1 ParB N-terminal domain-containing protein [Yersinia enterocolitica]
MAKNSFREMTRNGTITRRDRGMFIRLADIHIRKGFNKRVEDERKQTADDELFQYMMSGGIIPPLEVEPRSEGGVWVVEGHRRTQAYQRCAEAGKPVEWIAIIPFEGSNIDRIARISTSNGRQLPLTKFEEAMVVKDLMAFNLTPDEIAKYIHCSRPHVDKLIVLAGSNHDVQQVVKSGQVAMDAAVERAKEYQNDAGQVLAEDIKRAEEQGKKKVTKSMAQKKLSTVKVHRLLQLLSEAIIINESISTYPEAIEEIRNIIDEHRQLSVYGDDNG